MLPAVDRKFTEVAYNTVCSALYQERDGTITGARLESFGESRTVRARGGVVITTGGFVVELIFTIPGLGRYFVTAVQQLDYTVIMGTTVFYGAFLVLMVLLVDIIYGLVDPRIRLQGRSHA